MKAEVGTVDDATGFEGDGCDDDAVTTVGRLTGILVKSVVGMELVGLVLGVGHATHCE